jgi:AcrR family transcriptional regulator
MVQVLAETEGPRSKRAGILAAAIDSFGHDGYEHTKWAKIADEVGIGQTALYHYFESKAHCLLTIMSLELTRSLERFREVTADVDQADKALEAAIAAAYDVSPREVLQMRILQNHMDLLATRRPSAKEEVERQTARQRVREIETEWTALLERGMAAGDFPKRDAHALATVVLAMVVSVWRWYRPGGRMSLDQVRT